MILYTSRMLFYAKTPKVQIMDLPGFVMGRQYSVSLGGSGELNTRFLTKPLIPATSNPSKSTQHGSAPFSRLKLV